MTLQVGWSPLDIRKFLARLTRLEALRSGRIYEGNAASGDAQSNPDVAKTLADLKAGTPTPAATATIAVTYAKTEAEARERGAMADAAQETKSTAKPCAPARCRNASTCSGISVNVATAFSTRCAFTPWRLSSAPMPEDAQPVHWAKRVWRWSRG
jgi:hypothetical protein